MGGCAAEFCNNSSAKGYLMKIFPRDPQRRDQWRVNVNRKDWIPTDRTALCEVHFAPEMWERHRCDQKRKLKPFAIPTIFGFFIKEKPVLEIIKNNSPTSNEIPLKVFPKNEMIHDDEDDVCHMINQHSEPSTTLMTDLCETTIDQCNDCKCKKAENATEKLMKSITILKRKNRALKYNVRQLKNKLDNNKYKNALKKILTEDQIMALFTKNQRVRNWSNNTIQRALQLKFVCGTNGYTELKRLGMPLPSFRTLRRLKIVSPAFAKKI